MVPEIAMTRGRSSKRSVRPRNSSPSPACAKNAGKRARLDNAASTAPLHAHSASRMTRSRTPSSSSPSAAVFSIVATTASPNQDRLLRELAADRGYVDGSPRLCLAAPRRTRACTTATTTTNSQPSFPSTAPTSPSTSPAASSPPCIRILSPCIVTIR